MAKINKSDKTLVIVESPAKAKTINKYLGKNYIVEASVGHIKDLIPYGLGVYIEKNFQPVYKIIKGKEKIIEELKKQASKSKDVLIATDPDREGEAIAYHIAEEVKTKNPKIKRVLFNEITKTGIEKGLKELRDIDMNLVMSQQARRVLDRLIGFKVSPFLSNVMLSKTTKALSAGRVQSVALRLICEREELIQNFVPIEYWNIIGNFSYQNQIIKAKLYSIDGNVIKNPEGSAKGLTETETNKIQQKLEKLNYIRTEQEAKDLIEKIKQESFIIDEIIKKKVNRNPAPPFTTSSLQQEASRKLGFSNDKTMRLAQRLYEGVSIGSEGNVGLITYMRTDSVRISEDAQNSAYEHILANYGKEYLPTHKPQYHSKSSNVQDAHEAIRPTNVNYTPKEIQKYLDRDLARLYELIYNRFLASQMAPAIINQTTVSIKGGKYIFRATGSIIEFKGFLVLYDYEEDSSTDDQHKENENKLPADIRENEKIELIELNPLRSETKPPPRYNEASIVKELDEKGIGRPSTYAIIISTLLKRKYVELQKKAFYPTQLGIEVNKVLINYFNDIFNVDFTAKMEDELDTIAENKNTYLGVLRKFYSSFSDSLTKAEKQSNNTDIICDKCGSKMIIKVSTKGRFLACSAFPKCKNTKPLPKETSSEKTEPVIAEGIFCDICGKQMVIREGKYGKFYGCIDYPKCKGIKPFLSNVTCPKCNNGILTEKFSPKTKKKFWGCSNYPECDYLTNYEPVPKTCSNCGNYYLEVHYKKDGDHWHKYLICPQCKTNFEIEENETSSNS